AAELAEGGFQPGLDDRRTDKENVRRLVLCAGKVYYDLVGHAAKADESAVAVARIEQLYPFPIEQARALVASYPALEEVVWAQEEPQNMGPWRSIRHRLEEAAAGRPLRYIGRPWRASPTAGHPTAHPVDQDPIALTALAPHRRPPVTTDRPTRRPRLPP